MNQLLLAPTDVLFFRDGRPMGGALAGHGAAWPLPTVTNAALHAALWRSGLAKDARPHARKIERDRDDTRAEHFGSLTTVGPFPVCANGAAHTWFFPRPLDGDCTVVTEPDAPSPTGKKQTGRGTIQPVVCAPAIPLPGSTSSNPLPLSVASCVPPTKDTPAPWWSEGAWNTYLCTAQRGTPAEADLNARLFTKDDSDFSDHEATIGIGISPDTGTQDGEHIYSAHYLRLRDGWRLGLFAETAEKTGTHGDRRDLLAELFTPAGTLLLGGQQRTCTAHRSTIAPGTRLPLPLGLTSGFNMAAIPSLGTPQPKHLVKWVLLTPAIFPTINPAAGATDSEGRPLRAHAGGWLPSWVGDDSTHAILLRAPLPPRDVARESRDAYRNRVRNQPVFAATLVAALVPKPIPVTGWSLGNQSSGDSSSEIQLRTAGAKSTHLAVPAGAVYYFACDSESVAGPEIKTGAHVVLEEYALTLDSGSVDELAKELARICQDPLWRDLLSKRLAVVHDENFQHFVSTCTEVVTRVAIDPATRTVVGGALFNQENIPCETLFYSILSVLPSARKDSAHDANAKLAELLPETGRLLQIGGDETTGHGQCDTLRTAL